MFIKRIGDGAGKYRRHYHLGGEKTIVDRNCVRRKQKILMKQNRAGRHSNEMG